jgi:hypothetical protein
MKRAFVLMFLLAGCDPSDPCDADQVARGGLCYPAETGMDAAPAATGGADAAPAADPHEHYGLACASTEECPAPSHYCAIRPGQTEGYCSHTGCKEDPAVCPSSWRCVDLSVFQAGLPSVCTRN